MIEELRQKQFTLEFEFESRGISTVLQKSAGSGGRGESLEFEAGATLPVFC